MQNGQREKAMWPFRKRKSREDQEREFLSHVMSIVSYDGKIPHFQPPKKREDNVEKLVEKVIRSIKDETDQVYGDRPHGEIPHRFKAFRR